MDTNFQTTFRKPLAAKLPDRIISSEILETMAPPSEKTQSIYENIKTMDESLKIQQDSMKQRLNINVAENLGVKCSQASATQPLSDDVFGKGLKLNLTNSVFATNDQNTDKAQLGASTQLSLEKDGVSVFTSRNASLSTGVYTPTVTTTTGAEYNDNTMGAHINKTTGQNIDVLNVGGSFRHKDITARAEYFKDASMGNRTDLGLGYNPKNGVNLNAGYSNFNGQKSVNMGISVNNQNGLSPGINITSNGDYTSNVRYKMMTLGLSKIAQNKGFNFGTSFQF